MKQKMKEATGNAQATPLPEDIQSKIGYVEGWEARDRKLVKALNDMTSNWKKNGHRVEMMKAAEELAEDCENDLKTGAAELKNFLRMRIDKEKNAYEKGTQVFDKAMKTFYSSELRTIMEAIRSLKKKRLTRDSSANHNGNEDKQRKFEAADVDFQAAVKDVRDKMLKIPELDQMHADYVNQLMGVLATTYDDAR